MGSLGVPRVPGGPLVPGGSLNGVPLGSLDYPWRSLGGPCGGPLPTDPPPLAKRPPAPGPGREKSHIQKQKGSIRKTENFY